MKQRNSTLSIISVIIFLGIVSFFGYKYYLSRPLTMVSPTPTATVDPINSKAVECMANTTCKGNTPCMANPASVFCTCMGGEEKIVNGSDGQTGVCIINGREYDEWEYFRSFSASS